MEYLFFIYIILFILNTIIYFFILKKFWWEPNYPSVLIYTIWAWMVWGIVWALLNMKEIITDTNYLELIKWITTLITLYLFSIPFLEDHIKRFISIIIFTIIVFIEIFIVEIFI